jgi:hypothetical protein
LRHIIKPKEKLNPEQKFFLKSSLKNKRKKALEITSKSVFQVLEVYVFSKISKFGQVCSIPEHNRILYGDYDTCFVWSQQ